MEADIQNVRPQTVNGYLGATASKYQIGDIVSNTKENQAEERRNATTTAPKPIIGRPIGGRHRLEVPEQDLTEVPAVVRARALDLHIYVPDDGCGPYNSDWVFNFNLDAPSFTDKGLYVSDSGRAPEADMPAAPLGPDFTVTSTQHARVRVNATSCHANYEWSLDVQYVPPGGTTIEHYNVGPFQSYGVANNTTVYTGDQGPTGSVHVDQETSLTGNDPP